MIAKVATNGSFGEKPPGFDMALKPFICDCLKRLRSLDALPTFKQLMMSFAFALASSIVISGNVPSVFHTCLPFGLRVIATNCFDPVGRMRMKCPDINGSR